MARCLRCRAGNEWIEGDTRQLSKKDDRVIKRLRKLLEEARRSVESYAHEGHKPSGRLLERIDAELSMNSDSLERSAASGSIKE